MERRGSATLLEAKRLPSKLQRLGDRLAAAVRPVRVLRAVRWPIEAEEQFLAADGRELPRITADDYQRLQLPFCPHRLTQQIDAITQATRRTFGIHSAPGRLLLRRCREFRLVSRLLSVRGTPRFAELSRELYGTTLVAGAEPPFPLAAPTTRGLHFTHAAEDAADILRQRLTAYFRGEAQPRIFITEGLTAEASVEGSCLRLRQGAQFADRLIDLLEVHEGWVHLGTSFNALTQPTCGFLAKATPGTTRGQEGLAVLFEYLAGVTYPERVARLRLRWRAVAQAERGADFRDVYRLFREHGESQRDSYRQALRVFRGSLPSGAGPFTKDLSYGLGLAEQLHVLTSRREQFHLMFTGKVSADDLSDLAELRDDGWLRPAAFVPEIAQNARALRQRLAAVFTPFSRT